MERGLISGCGERSYWTFLRVSLHRMPRSKSTGSPSTPPTPKLGGKREEDGTWIYFCRISTSPGLQLKILNANKFEKNIMYIKKVYYLSFNRP
mmetsp:Transcript_8513/g.17505  ORF Transcript_8513/g.17505 Transcript_8513/m.17505 type:complete len:93 (-) Transcript_8513:91-369(-)